MNARFYRFCCGLLRPFFALFFPARLEGLEHIPTEGGFILCCNHLSARDPIYLALQVRLRHIHFMAKAELFRFKPLARILYSIGAFPVDRGHSDLNAVRTALRAGRPVIPAYIDGPYRPFRRTLVRFGAPVDLSEFGRRLDSQTLSQATRLIEDAVWSLRG